MTPSKPHATGSILAKISLAVGFTAVVILLLLTLAGVFHPKIGATPAHAVPTARPAGNTPLAQARLIRLPVTESAVGTIRPIHQTALASKILAKVLAVNVTAGQEVHAGDVLVRLDDEDLSARAQQVQAALDAARAARDQAQIEFDRTTKLHQQGNAAQIELERDQTRLRATQAELDRLDQSLREAQTILAYATLRSPINGRVIDKQIEVGDTVSPGQTLVTLYDRMQLIANVRESLTQRLKVGQSIPVRIDALDLTCEGQISEIVPEAQTASRSFQVKVTGPCPPGIIIGMFGRLLIPLDDEELLVIPRAAVRRVGQLDTVDVAEKSGDQLVLRRRALQLGRTCGDDIEVLSGLRPGEQVACPAP